VSRSGVVRWLRVAFDDVVLAATSVVRPWTDLRAVKLTQVDIVKAVAGQQDDLAKALAAVNALTHELSEMKAREAEQETMIRELLAAVDVLKRESSSILAPVAAPRAGAPSMVSAKNRD
jgi:hypothetical protein